MVQEWTLEGLHILPVPTEILDLSNIWTLLLPYSMDMSEVILNSVARIITYAVQEMIVKIIYRYY
jgi:hypothetical protein